MAASLLLLTPAKAQPSSTSSVVRTQARASLPPGSHLLTPYVSPDGATVLVHVQPSRGNGGEEFIVDARSGARWRGQPADVMAQYRRLGVESPAEVQSGKAFDQQMMRLLGCVAPVSFCTSPADAPVLLWMRWVRSGELGLDLVDLRPLLAGMDALMAGERTAQDVTSADQDWRLLQLASADPARRVRWLEALRSIDRIERWERVAAAAESGPHLLRWPAMRSERDSDISIDLAAELELSALRLNVSLLARAAGANPRPEQVRALADGLLLGSQIGFRGDVASHLVDVLLQRDDTERRGLADALALEARRRKVHGLWCYAEWMSLRPCAGQAPWESAAGTPSQASREQTPAPTAAPMATAPAPKPTSPLASATTAPAARAPIAPAPPAPAPAATTPQPPPPVTAATPRTPQREATTAQAGDAQQEWGLVQGQANKLVLLAYNETSGHMAPEAGAVAGLSFVARALGPLQDGRFEVQIAPNGRAPLLLSHGAYRVKVRLVLDYAREDGCKAGLLCLFSSAERHARTERRDAVFILNPGNRHTERQRVDFGPLVPLVADGSQRYTSTLKEARLAIDGVRFDLR